MNGRVYDPNLGRFLSADPYVQFPENGQSLNRYSYVLNNPLSFSDPSGFGLFSFLKKLFKPLLTIAVGYFTFKLGVVVAGLSNAAATALAGFTGGLAGSGGNLKMGFIGALTAGAFYGVGSYFKDAANNALRGLSNAAVRTLKVVAHGVVGGASQVLAGGKFLRGFISAGFTQASSNIKGLFTEGAGVNLGNAIKAAVIGGTASVIGGGKFANGAVTASFAYVATTVKGSLGFGGNPTRQDRSLEEISNDMLMVDEGLKRVRSYPEIQQLEKELGYDLDVRLDYSRGSRYKDGLVLINPAQVGTSVPALDPNVGTINVSIDRIIIHEFYHALQDVRGELGFINKFIFRADIEADAIRFTNSTLKNEPGRNPNSYFD